MFRASISVLKYNLTMRVLYLEGRIHRDDVIGCNNLQRGSFLKLFRFLTIYRNVRRVLALGESPAMLTLGSQARCTSTILAGH